MILFSAPLSKPQAVPTPSHRLLSLAARALLAAFAAMVLVVTVSRLGIEWEWFAQFGFPVRAAAPLAVAADDLCGG